MDVTPKLSGFMVHLAANLARQASIDPWDEKIRFKEAVGTV